MQNARMKPPTMDDVVSMFQASGLKAKLLFTFAMIVIFRLGVALPFLLVFLTRLVEASRFWFFQFVCHWNRILRKLGINSLCHVF